MRCGRRATVVSTASGPSGFLTWSVDSKITLNIAPGNQCEDKAARTGNSSSRCLTVSDQEIDVTQTTALTPAHPGKDGPDDFEPDQLPVEPDEGPVPDGVPDDPGQLRLVVAEDGRADSAYRSRPSS